MPKISDQTTVDAPIDEVFEYMATSKNHLDIMPSLVAIRDDEQLQNGGSAGTYRFEMMGTKRSGRFRDTTFDPPTRRVYELTGDIKGSVRYDLDSLDGRTRVRITHDVDAPGPGLMRRVTGPVVKRFLAGETEETLENLKRILENR